MAEQKHQPDQSDEDLELYQDEEGGDDTGGSQNEDTRVQLASGEALSPAEVDRFLRWKPATFVAIVGDKDSGKSTIMCAIYDRLLRGPFSGLGFARSRTLVALERRAHYSRVESGRATPDTPRTSILEDLHYFHLGLVGDDGPPTDVLISDRAGEVYRDARSDTRLVETLSELYQADRLVVLIDGRRANDPMERANALHVTRQSLRAFLDGGALGRDSVVQVVTTKMDLIMGSAEEEATTRAIAEFEERLLRDFGPRLAELTFWRIAARDPSGTFQPAHGIGELLTDWVRPKTDQVAEPAPKFLLTSEFDRLLVRTHYGEN
ncbi:hypothetical protein [Sinorhizobium sp. BJ1]|uniref:TRAFAC clade GTPase domain-containing protein n=1 Tax=Sinorhizobium sp. BJ1 TaxID=2035455 RepID=UPI000BE85258|nr:hypothetical protein [Sinorhizobium sp. BJ1]PDT81354.1 hypothetical protein CO676_22805 [Sinorhizobium sp. BJ1]